MFAIGVRFLTDRYAATLQTDEVEYPPHPVRLQMALVAAWGDGGRNPHEKEALEFLRRLPPPAIYAHPIYYKGFVDKKDDWMSYYVPNPAPHGIAFYDKIKTVSKKRIASNQPRIAPVANLARSDVYYIWDAELPPEHRIHLQNLMERTIYIGRSTSPVMLWFESNPPRPNFIPRPRVGRAQKTYYLRTFIPLSLLDRYHVEASRGDRRYLTTREFRYEPYAFVGQNTETMHEEISPTKGIFKHLYLFSVEPRVLNIVDALVVSKAFRNAVTMWWSKTYHEPAPSWLSGHKPDDSPLDDVHAAFFAVPFVRFPYADGRIMGLGIALPDRPQADIDKLLRLLITPGMLGFKGGSESERIVRVRNIDLVLRPPDDSAMLDPNLWIGPSREWVSVTPIVVAKHFRSKEKRNRVLKQYVTYSGFQEPSLIALKAVQIRGMVPLWQMPTLPYPNVSGRHQYFYAYLRFNTPQEGPMLIGSARYFGYGLCIPVRASDFLIPEMRAFVESCNTDRSTEETHEPIRPQAL